MHWLCSDGWRCQDGAHTWCSTLAPGRVKVVRCAGRVCRGAACWEGRAGAAGLSGARSHSQAQWHNVALLENMRIVAKHLSYSTVASSGVCCTAGSLQVFPPEGRGSMAVVRVCAASLSGLSKL